MRVGHLAQDGLHLGAQYRYLVEERRVEYCVGILLIGEYVLLLAAADAGPALQRREGVVAARIVVARDAAQQAVVRGGYAREVVHRHRRQTRDVDAELAAARDAGCQLRVETVYSLHDYDRLGAELERLLVPLARAGDEVVARHLDTLAVDKAFEVVVEQLQVYGFERLVIVFAVLILGRMLAVDEVVVERYDHGVEPEYAQLYAQTLREGSLAAGRGARYEHHPRAARLVCLRYAVGEVGYLLLVECLRHLDQIAGVAAQDFGVEAADGGYAHYPHPHLVLVEDIEHLVQMHLQVEFRGVCSQRHCDVESVVVGSYVEQVDISRVGGQGAVEESHHVIQTV